MLSGYYHLISSNVLAGGFREYTADLPRVIHIFITYHLDQQHPTFQAPGTGSVEGGFFSGLRWAWFHILPGFRACVDGASFVCMAQFLTGCRLVAVCRPGLGDICSRLCVMLYVAGTGFKLNIIQLLE